MQNNYIDIKRQQREPRRLQRYGNDCNDTQNNNTTNRQHVQKQSSQLKDNQDDYKEKKYLID